jgi:hypothetical protein
LPLGTKAILAKKDEGGPIVKSLGKGLVCLAARGELVLVILPEWKPVEVFREPGESGKGEHRVLGGRWREVGGGFLRSGWDWRGDLACLLASSPGVLDLLEVLADGGAGNGSLGLLRVAEKGFLEIGRELLERLNGVGVEE